MKGEYYLFLDESEDEENNVFAMSGVIVNTENLAALEEEIFQVKKIIWEESYVKKYHPILHSNEFNFVKKNATNQDRGRYSKGAYHNYAKHSTEEIIQIYHDVYHSLTQIVKNQSITTLCCAIQKKQMLELFHMGDSSFARSVLSDYYDIALQVLIENFCHFLILVDGVGHIVYEARSSQQLSENASDVKMQDDFCKVKVASKGITFLSETAIRKYIRNLEIVDKRYNNAGLQLADFVAFNFAKLIYSTKEEDKTSFMKQIYRYAYNGGFCLSYRDARAFFGVRILPSDVELCTNLVEQNKKMKNRLEHLKTERNKLNRKVDQIILEKRVLKEKYDKLLREIQQKNDLY